MNEPTPADLGPAGTDLWESVVSTWELRPDELAILHEAARTRDVIDTLTDGLVGEPLTVRGSMGQEVVHPLVAERRFQAGLLANLLGKLKLPNAVPDTELGTVFTDGPMTRSEVGRKGAQARWGRQRGYA
ncbi:hypothetical protein [Pseudonocardia sp. D17]|uniref:hypothetical protein n=1 Tax=Pseudonocardia sp. D17 TaxID=882661 RepID=UPI002B364C63|nr:hypothetical protein PSD17_66650 [Pseudonocardia sp. D17]